jgi:hypothetical protein
VEVDKVPARSCERGQQDNNELRDRLWKQLRKEKKKGRSAVFTCMVRLHALQRVNKETLPLHVNLASLGDEAALDVAAGPEGVAHGAPGILRISTEVAGSILAYDKARRCPCELEIHHVRFGRSGLDCVARTILRQVERDIVGEEGVLSVIEAPVVERVARPQVRGLAVRVEYFGVELGRGLDTPVAGMVSSIGTEFQIRANDEPRACVHSHDVAVDDLGHANVAAVCRNVERLRLNAGRVYDSPLEVIFGELSVRRLLCLLLNGLDGGGAIDGLLGPSNVCQSANINQQAGLGSSAATEDTDCCFAQLNIFN